MPRSLKKGPWVDDHLLKKVEAMNKAGVPCGPINTIDRTFEEPQVKHLGIAQHVPNNENRHIQLVGQPVTLSRTPSKMAARPPEFGEQTEEVLAEFGFGKDRIAFLKGPDTDKRLQNAARVICRTDECSPPGKAAGLSDGNRTCCNGS